MGFPLLVALAAVTLAPAANAGVNDPVPLDVHRPDVVQFIQEMHDRNGFDVEALTAEFADVRIQPATLDAMSRPAEKALAWYDYRARFINDQRVQEGIAFWAAHRELLDSVAEARGVPGEIVLGILGVETSFGRIIGKYRVIDALATLAFDYPPRSPFFRAELEQLLLLSREEAIDPRTVLGSYAGAMGSAQFMPSSYRRYAIDATADGKRDLWNDWADIFGSIANYLQVHGWASGEPVLADAEVDASRAASLGPTKVALEDTVATLREKGVHFDTTLRPDAPAMLIVAEQPDHVGYRVGFRNFYTLTRYNRSPLYSMAVSDLGAELVKRGTAVPPQGAQP
ncbi:MAG TPA: lytic murein transglycosylase B [Steroidobacteraceae bacterium]|nr:lytic murein transglycosylase B [Steroidobacteraceae bacterium]